MNEHEFSRRMRAHYEAEVAAAGEVPAALWADVSALPDSLPRSPRLRRRVVLLAAAAMLLAITIGAAIGIGTGLIHLPDLRPAPWTLTGPMTTPRTEGRAVTLLADGRVLVTGETTEIFTPGGWIFSAGTWVDAAGMHEARSGHTATLLADGRVLVAGGFEPQRSRNDDPIGLASAEIFDPASGRWTAVQAMHQPRNHHTATLLLDGRVLVVGGAGIPPNAMVDVFDPRTGTWEEGEPMLAPRHELTATRLLDGRVLIAGCQYPGDEGLPGAEIFDPVDGSWTEAGDMPYRCQHRAVLLADGRVLVIGDGYDWTGATAIFDPQTNSWAPSGKMRQPRVHFTATLLPDGRVLVAGSGDAEYGARPPGESDHTAEIYDPRTGRWSWATSMLRARGWHEGTLLSDGRVLLVGGFDGDRGLWDEAELYDPGSDH